MSEAASERREFEFSDAEFQYLRTLVKEQTGINLSPAKRELVYGRLAKRIRQIDLSGFREYCELLRSDPDGELGHMVNAITTNLTAFFRENHHFEFLKEQVFPELLQANSGSRRIRLWSAGCSTGEEPYSLAIATREAMHSRKNWDVKILATDVDTTVVERAKDGVYREDRVSGVSPERLRKWFAKRNDGAEPQVRVAGDLKELITFKQLNLMHEWPMKGPFDAIFCRNVLIYFDKQTQGQLADRYAELLRPGGHLFLGHSESLYKVSDRFELIGQTVYRKLNQ